MPFLFSACPLARHYAVFIFRMSIPRHYMPFLFYVCLFPRIICRCFLRLLARNFIPVLLSAVFWLCSLPPDCIRHSSFILSDAIRATFTLSYIGVASSSAYLGIKWHIFVKSDFFRASDSLWHTLYCTSASSKDNRGPRRTLTECIRWGERRTSE